MDSFTYVWTDHKTNKLYVGVHKGAENDGYIASSKTFLREYYLRAHDFSREIIASGSFADMRIFEMKILKSCQAASSNLFYNRSNGIPSGPYEVSFETRAKISKAHKGRKRPEGTGARISAATKGKKISEESKKKMSESKFRFYDNNDHPRLGMKNSEEHRRKISEKNKGREGTFKGRKHSEETKLKISEIKKNDPDHKKRCSEAGKISMAKRANDPEYKRQQSEKMKEIWARRKGEL